VTLAPGSVLACLLVWCPCALALNPALDVSQYAHTAWKVREGFAKGSILSIAQTPDGYLWVGTAFGLYRFDGVRNVPWQPAGQHLPSDTHHQPNRGRATGLFGSAQGMGCQAGRTASSLSMRNWLDRPSVLS